VKSSTRSRFACGVHVKVGGWPRPTSTVESNTVNEMADRPAMLRDAWTPPDWQMLTFIAEQRLGESLTRIVPSKS